MLLYINIYKVVHIRVSVGVGCVSSFCFPYIRGVCRVGVALSLSLVFVSLQCASGIAPVSATTGAVGTRESRLSGIHLFLVQDPQVPCYRVRIHGAGPTFLRGLSVKVLWTVKRSRKPTESSELLRARRVERGSSEGRLRGVTQHSVTRLNIAQEHKDTQDNTVCKSSTYTEMEQEKIISIKNECEIMTNVLHAFHALL